MGIHINVAFSEPVHDWGVEKMAAGTAGVLLGVVFVVAGLIYYKMNSAGERLILIKHQNQHLNSS